jgi:hypothetical protein
MATWKRLTQVGGNKIDVNMDQVLYISKILTSPTDIYFGAFSPSSGLMHLQVNETPDEIHVAGTLSNR